MPARLGHRTAFRTVADLLVADLAEPGPGTDVALPTLLDLLLIHLLRTWFEEESARRPHAGWIAALNDPVVAVALRHIHRDPARTWTVRDLGNTVGLARTAFTQRFTALVGQSPLAYLTWWRLSLAARLLQQSNETLAAIARRIGYSSEFAFANAFRREFGIAPGGFRRRHQEAGEETGITDRSAQDFLSR